MHFLYENWYLAPFNFRVATNRANTRSKFFSLQIHSLFSTESSEADFWTPFRKLFTTRPHLLARSSPVSEHRPVPVPSDLPLKRSPKLMIWNRSPTKIETISRSSHTALWPDSAAAPHRSRRRLSALLWNPSGPSSLRVPPGSPPLRSVFFS